MPIVERQLMRKNRQLVLDALRQGRVPSPAELANGLADIIKRADGGPLFRPILQRAKKLWDHIATNKVFDDIYFDLAVAFEELVSQYSDLISRMSFIELTSRSQRQQLDVLEGTLKNLAFVSKNVEDNFFGVFDTFSDLSKVNQRLSTTDVVDVTEQAAALPYNVITASRVDMAHLFDIQTWPVGVTMGDGSQHVQNEHLENAYFGLAFSDLLNSWKQLVTGNSTGCTISFAIPLTSNDDEVSISRIKLISDSPSNMRVSVLHSRDNVNFIKLPNVPDEFTILSQATFSLDFETTRVQFLRFTVTIDDASVQDGDSYGYLFAFRGIEFFGLGRAQQAEIVSKPLTATAMPRGISKVSMQTVDSQPNGTRIEYFVAPSDANGNLLSGGWRPITPINRTTSSAVPKVVKFGNTASESIYLPAPSPSLSYSTVRAASYYRLTDEDLNYTPIFGQAVLYRGENSWARSTTQASRLQTVRDSYIDFHSGDVQYLYAVVTEKADIETRTQTTTTPQTVLKVTRDIQHDPATMLLIPPTTVDATVDQRPRYAVYRVTRFRDNMTISDEEVTLTGEQFAQMSNRGIKTRGSGRPVVTNTLGSVIYIEGKDYILEEEENGEVLTGRIRRVSTSTISTGATVKVSYELESDITYLVDAVRGPRVFLKEYVGDVPDQYFEVTYRFTPLPSTYAIKQSTIVARSQYGRGDGVVFQEGPDYIVDVNRGTITRIPTGNVTGLELFVDFTYTEVPNELESFSIWVYVPTAEPARIVINPLDIDIEYGERITVDGVDVSSKTEWHELVFGWHQVFVKSRRPETVSTAAINQIATLRDRTGTPVFVAGGEYFSRITGFRAPMTQRTYTQLTKGTPVSDRSYFAIDNGHVIVNFEPGTTSDIYTYGLRLVEGVYTPDLWPEEFRLEYTYSVPDAEPVNYLLFRALLTRNNNTDAGITPKLYEYNIRLG